MRTDKADYRGSAYFEHFITEVHRCSGPEDAENNHVRIWSTPRSLRVQQLGTSDYRLHQGDVGKWFSALVSLTRIPEERYRCWDESCAGYRTDLRNIIVSIPVVLLIEVTEIDHDALGLDNGTHGTGIPSWNFPAHLMLSRTHTTKYGVEYDLLGLVFVSKDRSHFVIRYQHKQGIYAYDDTKDSGFSIKKYRAIKSTKTNATRIGDTPAGFVPWCGVYQLRGGSNAQDQFFQVRKTTL